jgi:hypothetical protein
MHSSSSTPIARRPIMSRLLGVVFVGALVTAAGLAPATSATAKSPSPATKPSTGTAAVAPTPSGAPPEVTWGIGPAVTAGADERPYFSFGVTPGAQANDHVTVVNYSATALNLSVYAVLADNNADTGAIGFVSGSDTPADAASWLTVGSSRPVAVTVPGRPNSSAPPGHLTLPVKLVVPLNAQPGDHVAGIVAALNVPSSNGEGEHVNLEQRVVTRVYVRVSGKLAPKLQIANLHASYHEKGYTLGAGSVLVRYTVRNVGNVRVAASQVVHVSGLLGGSKKAVPANIVQLLPGGSANVSVVVHGVWPTVLVHPHVTVTPSAFGGDVDPNLKKLTASTWTWAVPWLLLAVVVLVLAMLWWRYRRNRQRNAPSLAATATALPGSVGRHRVDAGQQAKSRHAR